MRLSAQPLHAVIARHADDNADKVRFTRDSGPQISRIASDTPNSQWPSDNLVLTSESHDNADGFAAKLTAGPGNVDPPTPARCGGPSAPTATSP